MKKCTLQHDVEKGFVLIDNDNEMIITKVDVGEIEDDIDWVIVEKKANDFGFTLY